MNKQKFIKSYMINIIIVFLAIIISCVIMNNTPYGSEYEYYFLVPLIFGFIIIFSPYISFTDMENMGPMLLNYTMLIKYMISPLIYCLSGYYSWWGIYPSPENIRWAVFYTIYEMIALMISSNIFAHHFAKKKKENLSTIQPLKTKMLYVMLIIIALTIIVLIPKAVADQRFILNQVDLSKTIRVDFAFSGIFTTFITFGRYSAIILIINYFYKKNLQKESKWNVILAFVPVFVNSLFVSNLSRISILVPMLTFSFLIYSLFDTKKARRMIISLFLIIVILFGSYLSFIKFFGEGRGNDSNLNNIEWWGDTLNMYFSGIKETAIGIKAQDLVDYNYGTFKIKLFLNDIISNVIGLSNLANTNLTSTKIFNYTYFGSDIAVCQIVPNIVEGIYYFGGIFSVAWPIIFVYFTYFFISIYKQQRYLDFKFVFLYASIYCAMILMINSAMIISNVINISVLFAILAFLNKKITLKKGDRNEG